MSRQLLFITLILGLAVLQISADQTQADCKAGTAFVDESKTCEKCAKGTYSANDGAAKCTPCEEGKYANIEGSTECTIVPAGSYPVEEGANFAKCAKGTFRATPGAKDKDDCLPCPEKTYADDVGFTECKTVPAGFYRSADADAKVPCAAGTFSDKEGASQCNKCPDGMYTDKTESQICQVAPGGFYPSANADSLVGCDLGTYREEDGGKSQADCTDCPTGWYTETVGSKSCIVAPVGTWTDKKALYPCPKGTARKDEGGSAETDCAKCNPGWYADQSGMAQCVQARPGYFTDADQQGSSPCPAGTERKEAGAKNQDECTACLEGFYAEKTGTAECTQAPKGTYADNNRQGTENCEVGKYNNQLGGKNADVCLPCKAGSYADKPGTVECTKAPKGGYASEDGTAVGYCEKGFYNSEEEKVGVGACLPCPAGQYTDHIQTEVCTPVPANFYPNADKTGIEACPEGTKSVAGANSKTDCRSCTAGQYFDQENKQCKIAPAGTRASDDGMTLTECEPGFYNDLEGQTVCLPCPDGQYSTNPKSTQCTDAPAGTYVNPTSTNFEECKKGTFNAKPKGKDDKACLPCPDGEYSENTKSTQCTPVPENSYPKADKTGVEPCPTGTKSPARAKSQAECKHCPAGQYLFEENGKKDCKNAPAGTKASEDGLSVIDCEAGTYNDKEGQSTCLPCPDGKYSTAAKSTQCTVAPKGAYVSADRKSFEICKKGTFNDQEGGKDSSACKQCEAGKYSDIEQASSCKTVPANHYPNDARTDVEKCPDGAKSPQGAKSKDECHSCPDGEEEDPKDPLKCVKIPPKYISCPKGSYHPSAQALKVEDCKKCEAGHYSDSDNAKECKRCGRGTISEGEGAAKCQLCELGSYEIGRTSCSSWAGSWRYIHRWFSD